MNAAATPADATPANATPAVTALRTTTAANYC